MDRLQTETLAGVVAQYTYDKNGNMLSRISATDKAFYTWDFDNRLIAADTNGDGAIDERNVYDANGVRVSQTVGGQETRFLIDTLQSYPQVVLEYRPSGLITVSYVYGTRLISQNRARRAVVLPCRSPGQHACADERPRCGNGSLPLRCVWQTACPERRYDKQLPVCWPAT